MSFPEFFAAVPRLALHDPLADILGAAANGLVEYGYTDAVKLTGHSCPTVAGAYLMTLKALAKPYPDGYPERGGIKVELKAAQPDGLPASPPPWPACSLAPQARAGSRDWGAALAAAICFNSRPQSTPSSASPGSTRARAWRLPTILKPCRPHPNCRH
ncbi:MAG: hypothetical protein WA108_06040 [Thiobacillus sp.]